VIIPHQNMINLMLNEEVVAAVAEGKFHVYAVKTVEEGIEILTGMPAGERGEDGNYPEGTINFLVEKKLKDYHGMLGKNAKETEKQDDPSKDSSTPAGEETPEE
jgi:hypothetical protein